MKFGCAARRARGQGRRGQLTGPARASCVRSKELQAAASEKADWASYYLDYKALKQILGQLTAPETEAHTEGNSQVRPARAALVAHGR